MKYLLTWAALGLGVVADLLFFNHAPGISVPIFTLLCLGVVWTVDRRAHKRLGAEAMVWSIGAFLASSAFALRANEGVLFVNALVLLVLMGLVLASAYGLSLKVVSPFTPVRWLFEMVPVAWIEACSEWRTWLPGWRLHGRAWRSMVWSLAIGLIFFILLFSAEPAFREFIARLISAEMLRKVITHAWVIGLVGMVAVVVLSAIRRAAKAEHVAPAFVPSTTDYSMEWVSVLGTSNAIFALFLFARFFEKAEVGTVVYSQMAREGFFSLIIAALCVVGMMWARRFFTAQENMPWQQALETLFVAQTVAVLVGAVARMNAYVSVYGLTYPRLIAWVMLWLIGVWVIALLIGSLSKKVTETHVWHAVMLSTVLAIFGTTIANPEALVVKYTLGRSVELSTGDFRSLNKQVGVDGYSQTSFDRAKKSEDACKESQAISKSLGTAYGGNCSTGYTGLQKRIENKMSLYGEENWQSFNFSYFVIQQNDCGHDWLPTCNQIKNEKSIKSDDWCGTESGLCAPESFE